MKNEYPKLMKSITSGCVIELTSRREGKVVIATEDSHPLGYYSTGWNMDVFKDYIYPVRRKLNTNI